MWEVITDKDGIDVSYRWFAFRKKAEAFAFQLKPSCSYNKISRSSSFYQEHAVQDLLLDVQTLLKQNHPRDQTLVPGLPFSSVPQPTYGWFWNVWI